MRILVHVAVTVAVAIFAACPPCIASESLKDAAPVAVASYSPYSSLKNQIDRIVQNQLLPYTNASIKVYSLTKKETLYELNSRLLLTPASNQKLFTAATALSTFGKDHEVATTVSFDPATATIYLKGCGDSLLTEADLADLAKAAATKLDHHREYALAADLSCFDDLYWGKGWMWDDEPDSDEMYITPLAVNHNTVTVTVSPGKGAGMPGKVAISPDSPLLKIDNKSVTGDPDDTETVKADRHPGDRDNAITVSGLIPSGAEPVVKHISVWKPERVALMQFAGYLRAQGITITGTGSAPTPAGSQVIAQEKRTVGEILAFCMKESDNLSAESLIKLLGLELTGEPGSAEAGAVAILRHLDELGIPVENLVIADGSGVSRYNLTNSDAIIRLLDAVYHDDKIYRTFYNSLPIAGKDGTLEKRMKGTPAEGNVRGKTGNMEGVSALSGYLRTAEGEPLAFSIMIENFTGKAHPFLDVQDDIVSLLCRFHR